MIPRLFDGKATGDGIRVWVPGCATGEETYSIGILLLEEAARRELELEIQVFGSDLDPGALAVAREGRYPATIEADVSEPRLRRFFSAKATTIASAGNSAMFWCLRATASSGMPPSRIST